MHPRPRTRWRFVLRVEALESRCLLSGGTLTIALDPTLDQFGDQIVTIQAYGDVGRTAFSIFDTGATSIAFSSQDRSNFVPSIPVKVQGGATAQGLGGRFTGDVSRPDLILADGLHAAHLTFDSAGLPIFTYEFDVHSAGANPIQAFLGTTAGSPMLTTVTGTPILEQTSTHPNGLSAMVNMRGTTLDFSSIVAGLQLTLPDLQFIEPGTTLSGGTGLTDPVTIALRPQGQDNHGHLGVSVSQAPSPLQAQVEVVQGGHHLGAQSFLFDTGSQVTLLSPAAATALGIDLQHPETTLVLQGAGGTIQVPGYTLNQLNLPTTTGDTLQFTQVPIFVVNVGAGLDGVLGMNLFNMASGLLINPFQHGTSSASFTFFTNGSRGNDGRGNRGGLAVLQSLGVPFVGSILAGNQVPVFQMGSGALSGQVFNDRNGDGVRDENEPGLGGWTVYLDDNNNGVLDAGEATESTDGDGNYEFGNLLPGDVTVREIVQPGWVQTTASPTVMVHEGQDVSGIDLGNFEQFSISGRVFEDATGDGHDTGDAGLAGWTVYVDANGDGQLDGGDPSTLTDGQGNYQFDGLGPGTYMVHEIPQIGWVQTTADPGPIEGQSGVDVSGVNFGNFRRITVGGQVFHDLNGNGQLDAGEPGLPGVTVHLDATSGSSLELSGTTDAYGNYSFAGLRPGDYQLSQVVPAGMMQTTPPPGPIEAQSGVDVSGIDFGDFRAAGICGHVFADLNGNGVRDPGEPGVPGILLKLYSVQASGPLTGRVASPPESALDSETTDGNGAYCFMQLPPGTYRVEPVNPSGWVTTTGTPPVITVQSGLHLETDDFGEFRTVSIGGRVFDDAYGMRTGSGTNAGLGGYTLQLIRDTNGNGLRDAGEPVIATTVSADQGGGGAYRFTNVGPGRYIVAEIPQPGRLQVYPAAPGTYSVSVYSGYPINGLDFGNIGDSRRSFVYQMYHDLLHRTADAAGLDYWAGRLAAGFTRADVVQQIEASLEYRSLLVRAAYKQFLHRSADSAGLSAFTAFLGTGGTLPQVASMITSSQEYYQQSGGTTDGYLQSLFHDALHRDIDTFGRAAFTQLLASGGTRAQVAEAIFGSLEFRQKLLDSGNVPADGMLTGLYPYFLHRSADRAGLQGFLGALQGGAREQDVIAALAGSEEYLNAL